MEEIKDIERFHKIFICKKKRNINKSIKNKKKKITKEQSTKEKCSKDSILENSTDLSSNNLISLDEKSDAILKVPSLDDIVIPSFLNDITKYNKINKKINKYYKFRKLFNSPELAEIYLIDVKRLYEEKKKFNYSDKF